MDMNKTRKKQINFGRKYKVNKEVSPEYILHLQAFHVEARIGIGQISPLLHLKYA
jgi:hypothetical protein